MEKGIESGKNIDVDVEVEVLKEIILEERIFSLLFNE